MPRRPRAQEPLVRLLGVGAPVWRSRPGYATARRLPSRHPGTAALAWSGEFDAHSAVCPGEALDAVRTPWTERVLLDPTGVEFADAAFAHHRPPPPTTAHRPPPSPTIARRACSWPVPSLGPYAGSSASPAPGSSSLSFPGGPDD
ncbi:hypothetical protein AB0E83_12420 [Streptomyces sp. NPDC035033]|uniref:hypothetical protein n=1 Tax=Streptomyces sp. NPDC035033 TaxID=3155368 RepID=UPI0033E4A7B4